MSVGELDPNVILEADTIVQLPEQGKPGGIFRRFRAVGSSALAANTQAAPQAPELSVAPEADEALFGLEEEFNEYASLWQQHDSVYETFMGNPEHRQQFKQVLQERIGINGRKQRRDVNRVFGGDFQDYTVMARMRGRVLAAHTGLSWGTFRRTKELANNDLSVGRALKTANSYYEGLFHEDNIKQTESVLLFAQNLDNLAEASRKTYRPIVEKEDAINEKIRTRLEQHPEAAVEFLDTFLAAAESQALVDKTFVTYFVNDFLRYGNESVVAEARNKMQEFTNEGGLLHDFFMDKLEEYEGKNIVTLLARALGHSAESQEFLEFMVGQMDTWPPEIAGPYDEYCRAAKVKYGQELDKILDRAGRKDRMRPDIHLYDLLVQRLFIRLHGKIDASLRNLSEQELFSANASREISAVTPQLKIPEQRKKLSVGVVVPNGNGMRIDTSISDAVEKFIGRDDKNADLANDMKQVVNRLISEPFGLGIEILKDRKVNIGGKRIPLYRAKPDHIPMLNLSKRAQSARVMFVVLGGTIGIVDIPTDHQKYQQSQKRFGR